MTEMQLVRHGGFKRSQRSPLIPSTIGTPSHGSFLEELHVALDEAEANDARAIILRHEGPAFCAGADLKERSSGPPTQAQW